MANRPLRLASIGLLAGLAITGGAIGPTWAADYVAEGRKLLDQGNVKAAQIELRNAVKADDKNAEAHYFLGIVDFRLGDAGATEREARRALELGYDSDKATPLLAESYLAQSKFRELLAEFPAGKGAPDAAARILVARGLAQFNLKQSDAARASLAEAEKLAPDSMEVLLAASRIAELQGDRTTAEKEIDHALKVKPRSAEALFRKGELQAARNDIDGALKSYDAAIEAAPAGLGPRLERARLRILKGEDARAKADVDAVLTAAPTNPQGLFLRAVLLTRAHDFKAADEAMTRVGAMMPAIPQAYLYQAIIKDGLGQYEQADDVASRYLSRYPADLVGRKVYAKIQLELRRPEKAIETLEPVAKADVPDPGSYDLLGRAYMLAGRPADAEKAFEKAAKLAPDDAGLRQRLGAAHLQSGDPAAAVKDLEASLKLAPNQVQAGEALVLAAIAAGEYDRANAALDAMRKEQGDNATVGNLAGLLKLGQSDLTGARAAFEAALQKSPDSVPIKLNLVRVLSLLGDRAGAEKLLTEVVAKNPTNETALSALLNAQLADQHKADALATAERAHAAAPTNERLTGLLAALYMQTGTPNKALELLARWAQQTPLTPGLLVLQARAQMAVGQAKEARETYQRLVAKQPLDVAARMTLASLLAGEKNMDDARNTVLDGLKLLPANAQLMQALVGIDLKVGGLPAALQTAANLAQNPAHLPAASALKGEIYMAQKNYPEAATAFEAAFTAAPSTPLLLDLAGALAAGGHPNESTARLRDWLKQHPDDADISQIVAASDIGAGRLDEAETLLTSVLAKRPSDPIALNNLAWLYGQRGDPRAQSFAERAYFTAPGPQTADTLGWILLKSGKTDSAISLLRIANGQAPNDPAIAYHLATALSGAGQDEAAQKLLEPIVAATVAFPEKAAAKSLLDQLAARNK